MGTPEFARAPLHALVKAGYEVVAVYTQPPRPKGRGYAQTFSPVHQFAQEQGIPVYTPVSLKSPEEQEIFRQLNADLAIVAAYGLLLPKPILEAPKLGCINIHASLLPRWRGAAPIHRAIEAGDVQTGITIMQMDAGLDTGPMLYTKTISIEANETTQMLHDKMLALGTQALLECLPDILSGQLPPVAQPLEGVTYAHKLKKEESALDFEDNAEVIFRKIRALTPWPGTTATLDGEQIKILEAEAISVSLSYSPGTWVVTADHQLLISCKIGAIQLKMLQRPGSKSISSSDFLNGYRGSAIIFLKTI
jgi:methionyl-tRNA formyltransferase